VSGSAKPGGTLSCTQGVWKDDIVSASLYRAPTGYAYQWNRSGEAVVGATSATVAADAVGEYRCTVTASNPAGSASQTSTVAAVFKLGKARLNKKKGTAKLPVSLPGSGQLKVSGKGYKAAAKSVKSAKTLKLTIRAKGGSLKKLKATGKTKLKLTFAFSTSDGSVATQNKSIVLRKK
jgi:hypothetical protein